ncbi:amidohydrolase family protein [Streptomyces muensis]|uniref:Amidohydrolase family protein n=1 Tax=Streptomyces muensis TaxID=1077944 RepID=A0A9X1PSS4_STRM4|nr:amidohydrolase family protein [Streptomyces muensis]MCF1592336.1 amidohydrolase family protein [Streptomyces muensis]
MTGLLVRNVLLDGCAVDVRARRGVIVAVGTDLRPNGEEHVFEGERATVLPGLHDHHVHLLATAARQGSVDVGPNVTPDLDGFMAKLRSAARELPLGTWLRAVGYHETVAGDLDRTVLDAAVPDRPVRVQHRSGALWVVNSAALAELDLARGPAGLERDERGMPTGRLYRADDWLRRQVPGGGAPDLAALGAQLVSWGITGVTDATPFQDSTGLETLAEACRSGALPQRVVAMGGPELVDARFPAPLFRGPVKVVLDEFALPALDEFTALIARAHAFGRPAAVHTVTRTSLVFALAGFRAAGAVRGDRIEHGSVIPPEHWQDIARLGLTVVTQPAFVAERGDQYLRDVAPEDQPYLYPCGRLLEAGVAVGGSSDMPYTHGDPWAAMRAAVERKTESRARLGIDDRVPPEIALNLYLTNSMAPGGPARAVTPGSPADLLLFEGQPTTKNDLTADRVVATVVDGVVWAN